MLRRYIPRLAPAVALLLGACISLEDVHIPKGAILKDQRTVLAVFAGPGPVISQDDNKAETAAKLTPGLAYIVQAAQNEKETAASKDLGQYLPSWEPAKELETALKKVLPASGHPGRFIAPDEGGIAPEDMTRLDKASDILDWRLRYYITTPDHPVPRNYSTFLQLDDALIFEVNLAYGVALDDQQNAWPQLNTMTKLFRANTMHLLWKHENTVEDKGGLKLLYEYKRNGVALIDAYRKMLPGLASAIVADYRKELSGIGPAGIGPSVPASTAAASNLPTSLPPGWTAPAASTAPAAVPAAPSSVLPSGWTMPAQTPEPGRGPTKP